MLPIRIRDSCVGMALLSSLWLLLLLGQQSHAFSLPHPVAVARFHQKTKWLVVSNTHMMRGDGMPNFPTRRTTRSRRSKSWTQQQQRTQLQTLQWSRELPPPLHASESLLQSAASDAGSSSAVVTTTTRDATLKRIRQFGSKHFFLLGMFVAVTLANLFPSLGCTGGILRPELFIGKFGVAFVFLLSGLSLQLSQLAQAASNVKLNGLTQLMTFVAWPYLLGLPLKAFFSMPSLAGAFPNALLDGILILTCLPTTVNMCVILTSSVSGNTAAAVSNAVISNIAGIFVTPALLFRFFGASIHLPFMDMVRQLCSKVFLPVAIGQSLRVTPLKAWYEKNVTLCKRMQEVVLLSILWNAFCTAIISKLGVEIQHGLLLILVLSSLHSLSLGVLFQFFSLPIFRFSRGDIIAAMFCSSQKTLAFGLPLINTVFYGNPNVALYCAPLMLVHPLQLMIGSALVPKLEEYISQGD